MKNQFAILLVCLMSSHVFAQGFFENMKSKLMPSNEDQVVVLKDGTGRGKLIINQSVIFDTYDSRKDDYKTYDLIGESELIRFETSPVTTSGVVAVFKSTRAPLGEFRLLFLDKAVRGMVPVPWLNQNISSLQITVDSCKNLKNSFLVKSSIDMHIGQCAIDLQKLKMSPK